MDFNVLHRVKTVVSLWGKKVDRVHAEEHVQGSPERCRFRIVVSTGSARFLLEELDPANVARKETVARVLEGLSLKGLAVSPPLRGRDNKFIQNCQGRPWQLSFFVEGIRLHQDSYWQDAWRGRVLARFLFELQQAGGNLGQGCPPFDLPGYIRRIERDTRTHHPEVCSRLGPVFRLLGERLPPALERMPLAFCHGDPHPLNVIWGQKGIRAVIDWEFCGPKPVLYDPALVIGCVGTETPEARTGPFVTAFMGTLRDVGLLTPALEEMLPLFVLAQRIPWLAEWLRRNDRDMIAFELFYLDLLLREYCPTGL